MTSTQASADLPCWDERTRPRAPRYPDAGAAGHAAGEHLRMVHDLFRDGLARIAAVVERAAAGQADLGEARAVVQQVGLRSAYEQVGSFCGQLCRSVAMHHGIEDAHLYPALRQADEDLAAVLDRLYDEHDVVHAMLVRVDETLVAMAQDPRRFGRLRRELTHLRALLESHFAYEEDAIGVALGVHGVLT